MKLCAFCKTQILLDVKGFPVSKYWKGTPWRVDEAYCSAKCSLDKHEITGKQ